MVFISDGVVVSVIMIIRSLKRYDLVKIKLTKWEENSFRLWIRRLQSSENQFAGVGSRSGGIDLSQC